MKVSIYVDWTNQEVLAEKNIAKFREEKTEELMSDIHNCNVDFADWLEENFTPYDIFKNARKNHNFLNDLVEEYKCDYVVDAVEENISELFEKIEIDI